MTEPNLLMDCVRWLSQLELPCMLTRSMAGNYCGLARTTDDLDFVIEVALSTAPNLVDGFKHEFFIDEPTGRADFHPLYVFSAINNRSGLKIDFWRLQPHSFEQQMFAQRENVAFFGAPAWIATAEDLLLHKLYWDRISLAERRVADAAGITAVQKSGPDEAYLQLWTAEIRCVRHNFRGNAGWEKEAATEWNGKVLNPNSHLPIVSCGLTVKANGQNKF